MLRRLLVSALLALVVALLVPVASAWACDCPHREVEETFDAAQQVFVARVAHEEYRSRTTPDGDIVGDGHRFEYGLLHALKGTVDERFTVELESLSNCYPWAAEGEVVLLYLIDGQTPSICTNSGQVLGFLRSGALARLLAHAGGTDTIEAPALELALAGATGFFASGAGDEEARVDLVLPALAGTTLELAGELRVRVIAAADEAREQARVITVDTVRSHGELSLVVLRQPAEGMVLRALVLTGDAPALVVRELVEE